MQTEISSKSELESLASSLETNTKALGNSLKSLKSTLSQARDYDGIDVTTAAKILKNNLDIIMDDAEIASKNIRSYAAGIENLDRDDFSSQAGVFSLSNIKNNVADIFTFNTPNFISVGINNAKVNLSNFKKTILDKSWILNHNFIATGINNAKINLSNYKNKIVNGINNIFDKDVSVGPNANLSLEDKLAIQYGFEPYRGVRLTAEMGYNANGPTGPESWYNMDMTQNILPLMRQEGYTGEGVMGVNEYGAKTLDGLVMCAAYLKNRPKGTIVQTSLGVGIVVDTGSAFYPWDKANYKWKDPNHLEIATAWGNEWKA